MALVNMREYVIEKHPTQELDGIRQERLVLSEIDDVADNGVDNRLHKPAETHGPLKANLTSLACNGCLRWSVGSLAPYDLFAC
jgi:hypothetical protein